MNKKDSMFAIGGFTKVVCGLTIAVESSKSAYVGMRLLEEGLRDLTKANPPDLVFKSIVEITSTVKSDVSSLKDFIGRAKGTIKFFYDVSPNKLGITELANRLEDKFKTIYSEISREW